MHTLIHQGYGSAGFKPADPGHPGRDAPSGLKVTKKAQINLNM